jgi:hypothetical protein
LSHNDLTTRYVCGKLEINENGIPPLIQYEVGRFDVPINNASGVDEHIVYGSETQRLLVKLVPTSKLLLLVVRSNKKPTVQMSNNDANNEQL